MTSSGVARAELDPRIPAPATDPDPAMAPDPATDPATDPDPDPDPATDPAGLDRRIPARAGLDADGQAGLGAVRFLLVLTHGAGGSPGSPDLLAVRDAALGLGGLVARVTQPYRVRGARAPGSPDRQDAAWAEIVAALVGLVPGVPLVQGGRSNGARVACRTAAAVGARAVIALAFPLQPPGPRGQSRLAELRAARAGGAAVLVVTGERDPFGIPGARDADRVVVVPGETHALRGHRAVIGGAVTNWLPGVLRSRVSTQG